MPQSYGWAQEAQVDWYEAWVDLGDERTRVQVFAMRSMASGAAFHRAYLHATQQAFLEAHEHAFAYFGGVFRLLRYDNLASAVRKILRGYRREETVRFVVHNEDPIDHEFILGDRTVQIAHEHGTQAYHAPSPGVMTVPAGQTRVTTYTFRAAGPLIIGCHLPGHYAYGMRAPVTVV